MGPRVGAISRLHAFPRPEQHLTQQTLSGGVVTVVGTVTALALFVHELWFFLTPTLDYKMAVDPTVRGRQLPIFFDITFPSLPCQVLEVDTIDASGEADMDLHGSAIHKIRLDSLGNHISKEKVKVSKSKRKQGHGRSLLSEDENLPARKGEGGNGKDAMGDMWMPILEMFNFTGMEESAEQMQRALDAKEGCRLTGQVSVARVAGNLHLSVHVQHFFVVQRVFATSERINMSHVIHALGFGHQYPGRVNPLDGVARIIHPLAPGEKEDDNPHQIGTFKYFLKVVPTTYTYLGGRSVDTNQFSVSEYFSPVDTRQFGNLPALNFVYDLSPIVVLITEERKNFFHFITRLCAVIGGALALTGMLNKAVYAFFKSVTAASKRKA